MLPGDLFLAAHLFEGPILFLKMIDFFLR